MQSFSKAMLIGHLNNKINTEKGLRKNCNKMEKILKNDRIYNDFR